MLWVQGLRRVHARPFSDFLWVVFVTQPSVGDGQLSYRLRQPGTSHVTFRHPGGAKLTVPAHKPIKPVYVRLFVRLVREGIGG